MFILPQIISGGLLANKALENSTIAADKAREAADTLKRIEAQNAETLKRIESQNSEIRRLKAVEVQRIETRSIEITQPKSVERKVSQVSRSSPAPISVMVACSQCGKQTLRSNKRCIICGHLW
jgi:predicted nucleic acid-binding Zn ribbon protein